MLTQAQLKNGKPTVDGSEIQQAPPELGCIKRVVNNGINCQPQLVNAGFLPSTVFPTPWTET